MLLYYYTITHFLVLKQIGLTPKWRKNLHTTALKHTLTISKSNLPRI